MPPPIGKGAISIAFIRPSVHPSVTYIVGNLSVFKFGTKVPHLWCDSHTSFKVKVTRHINTETYCLPCLLNGKAYELQTWYTDGGQRPASATGAWTPRSKVKVARSRDQSEPSWPNAVLVSLETGGRGGRLCWPNQAATVLVVWNLMDDSFLVNRYIEIWLLLHVCIELLHRTSVQNMGNYQEYVKRLPPPMREIETQPARQHTFGNPFKVNKVSK